MMNSDSRREAAAIIKEVLELTGEEYLHRWIDEPLEKAAATFEFDREAAVTHQTFLQITGGFVRHVYEKGLLFRRIMSASESRAEAMAILEEGYQSAEGRGYDFAFLDALKGLEEVVAQMAEYMTLKERARHVRWVYATRIELLDWPIRCAIAEILVERWGYFMPPNLRNCPSAQLAYILPELVKCCDFRQQNGQ